LYNWLAALDARRENHRAYTQRDQRQILPEVRQPPLKRSSYSGALANHFRTLPELGFDSRRNDDPSSAAVVDDGPLESHAAAVTQR
jgi:hypothetical protein